MLVNDFVMSPLHIPGRRPSEATRVITGLGPHFWPQEDPVWGSGYNEASSSTTKRTQTQGDKHASERRWGVVQPREASVALLETDGSFRSLGKT